MTWFSPVNVDCPLYMYVKLFISCYSLRDRLKKLTAEKDNLESQLKNEKDERDLYKVKNFF